MNVGFLELRIRQFGQAFEGELKNRAIKFYLQRANVSAEKNLLTGIYFSQQKHSDRQSLLPCQRRSANFY
jgi:hypothetical protein